MNTENDFLETLLKQGPQLSLEQYAVYRRNLRERLARAEREERSMRRIVFIVGGLAGVLWFGWAGFFINDVQALPGIVFVLLVALSVLVPVFGGYAVLLYFLKYRPRVRDAQQQEERALLLDLQRQIDQLRGQFSRPES